MGVVSMFGSVSKGCLQWKRRGAIPRVLYWKLLVHVSFMAGVRHGSVSWKMGASGLGLPPMQVTRLVTTSTTKCRCKAMVSSATTKARSPPSRGHSRRTREALVTGHSNRSRGRMQARKPVSSIINDVGTAYHEGTSEEIRQLMEEWEADLNRQTDMMEIDKEDLRAMVLEPGHTRGRIT